MRMRGAAVAACAAAALVLLFTWAVWHVTSRDTTTATRSTALPGTPAATAEAPTVPVPTGLVTVPPYTNRQVKADTARLRRWRREFSYVPVPPSRPADPDHEIRLETHVLGTSVRYLSPRGTLSAQYLSPRGTVPFIVQFAGPVREEWKEAVVAAGGVLRGYLPNNAFVVELTEAARARVEGLDPVQWVGEYKPDYKIQPFLSYLADRLAAEEPPPADTAGDVPVSALVDVAIQTFAPEDAESVASEVLKAGGTVRARVPGRRWGLVRATIPASALARLALLGSVQWIEEFVAPRLNNDFAVRGDHLNVTNVWVTYGLTGYKQVIGHADSGLDTGNTNYLHPDFAGRLKAVFALGRPGDWSDTHGHGTHTAGSILGDGSASTGRFSGIAHAAQLVHQSVMDAGGGLGGLPADLNDLFLQTYTNGARIHSDSWGSDVYGQYTEDSRYVDEFMWDHKDMLIVFSAGNEGTDGNSDGVVDRDSIGSPATAKNLLSVGAAESDRLPGSGGYSAYTWGAAWPSDFPADPIRIDYISKSMDGLHQGMAGFSSRGPTDDGRVKPDIVGPGTDVISCRSRAPGAGTGWGAHPNTNYAFSGGTSMSTPLLAGCSALVRQYFMERRGMTNPSAALLKAALLAGGRSLSPGQYGTNATLEVPGAPRPNYVEGWGQANLVDALFPAAPRMIVACDTNRLGTGQTNTYRISLGSTNRATIMLTYSDFPGTAGAGKKLVNDLDLRIAGPGGSDYFPNGRTSPDRTNNVEGIDIVAPVAGVYTVCVSGFNVPEGPQPYALLVNGPWYPLAHTPPDNTTNTVDDYALDVVITSLNSADTNTYALMWNTTGSSRFATNSLAWVTGNTWRTTVPAQPTNTTVYYYFEASLEGSARRAPTNAPDVLYHFAVTPPVALTVTGQPGEYGSVAPAYGVHPYAVSNGVDASASAFSVPVGLTRFACTGWTGSGSVPASGASNAFSFVVLEDSALTWRWQPQYGLEQTSTVAGLLYTTTWWFAGATGSTEQVQTALPLGGTNYRFGGWTLDGARQPDETNVAANPVAGIAMDTSHVAVALYLDEDEDLDGDGLADWWEYYYFGSTNAAVDADDDGDGYTNALEFADETDPRNPASVPQPPVISHTPLSDPRGTSAPWKVSATVTDNVSVASVTLWWQRNAGTWQNAPMTGATNLYTNSIPAPGTNGDHFAYRIEAADAAGLVATNGPHAFDVVYAVCSLTPTNFDQWLGVADTTNRTLAVGNGGNTDLVWTISPQYVGEKWMDGESGTNDWSHYGTNDLWHLVTNNVYAGSYAWYCGNSLTDLYSNNMDCVLASPTLRLRAGARVTFRQWFQTEFCCDVCEVEVSTNGGASYVTLASNRGASGGWKGQTNDLSAYAGKDVIVRFRFKSNNAVVNTGWYVDNILISPITLTGGVSWLTLSATNGMVSPGAQSNVVLTFNSTGLSAGDVRNARLDFFSNDPASPSNQVPATLRIGTPPVVDHTPPGNTTNTVDPYELYATITPLALPDTNQLFAFWNTNGSPSLFSTAAMVRVAGTLYRANLPAQSAGTRLYYYLYARGTNGFVARHPTNAPVGLHSFEVTPPLFLTVTGTPLEVGTVTPDYGVWGLASGIVVNASAEALTVPSGGTRYACTGWVGSGSVPALGGSNVVGFTMEADSALDWQWRTEYALIQSSGVAGLLATTTWWTGGTTAATVAAESSVALSGTTYRFGTWLLDGVRQADASNRAVNPVAGVVMSTSRTALAVYLPEDQDGNGNGMADWWELNYGFSTSAPGDAVARYVLWRQMGRELVLDGVDDFVRSVNLDWTTNEAFSIGFWLRPESASGAHGLFGVAETAAWSWVQSDADVRFVYFAPDGGTSLSLAAAGVLATDRWTHLLVSYSPASTAAALYVDGRLRATDSDVGSGFASSTDRACVGWASVEPGSNAWFAGRVDDVTVWDTALASNTVWWIFAAHSVPAGLLVRYLFDSDAGGVAYDGSGLGNDGTYENGATNADSTLAWDSSGNGHHGLINGGAWVADDLQGYALEFGGSGYIVVPHDDALAPTAAISCLMWARPAAISDWDTLLIKTADLNWTNGYGVYGLSAGSLAVFVNDYDAQKALAPVTTGEWTHLAGTYDGAQVLAYEDGVPTDTNAYAQPIGVNTDPLYIGGYGPSYNLQGRLADVRLYNSALGGDAIRSVAEPAGDADGDGVANAIEYRDRTDPRDPASVPQPPVIDHTPLADPQATPAPWLVSATVTDNYTVSSVVLWWSRNGGGWDSAAMGDAGGNVYTNNIPLPGTNGDSFAYRIEASDPAGHTSTAGVHAFDVEYPLVSIVPTNLEENWLSPEAVWVRTLTISNWGNAPLTWAIQQQAAGFKDLVEAGAGAWTHGGALDLWRVATNRSYSPTHSWYAGQVAMPAYVDNMNCWLESPSVPLVGASRLSIRYWAETELDEVVAGYAYDGGIVELSTNDGATYAQIEPEGGYPFLARGVHGSPFAPDTPCFAGTGGWSEATFDLSAYAGREVRVRFRFGSDESYVVGEGWYLDDIVFYPAPGTSAWLTLSVSNGVLAAGSSTNIQVTFDAAGLADGERLGAMLDVTGDDPLSPTSRVPASMYVGPCVEIDHTALVNTTNTVDDYEVSAEVTPLGPFDTNGFTMSILWNTNGSTNVFTTNTMVNVSNSVWQGTIPAQPLLTHVYYMLRGAVDASVAVHPAGAPTVLHHFQVNPPVELVVSGVPNPIGSPQPPYGTNVFSEGNSVTAWSFPTMTMTGTMYACTGWVGSGSVPATGSGYLVSFTITNASTLAWQWQTRQRFLQTSTVEGIIYSYAWTNVGATVQTVTAEAEVELESVWHRFAGWSVDGARKPNATNLAVNPVTNIVMNVPHTASALYLPSDQDDDGDGLPDWWEYYQYGSTNRPADNDEDGDTFSDLAEYREGTDPRDPLSKPAPPVIQHTPLTNPQFDPPPWEITAVVTDNFALARSSEAGSALLFDGTNDFVIRNPVDNFPSAALTVEFWMKSSDAVNHGTPFSYATAGDANEFAIYNYNTFIIYRGSELVYTEVNATDGTWHHIAVTWRQSDGAAQLYKDGTLAWSGEIAEGKGIQGGGSMVFGHDQDSVGGGFNPVDAFKGLLDEMRVWSVVRTEDEIRQGMTNALTGLETGLYGLWSFDEGEGTTAYDTTTNGNDVTLYEPDWTNSTAGVSAADVTVWWNRNSNGWQSARMLMDPSGQYLGTVPPPGEHGDHFLYRIEADDTAGLTATSGPHTVTIVHPVIVLEPPSVEDVWLAPGAVTNRSLSVSNAGSGSLVWNIGRLPFGMDDDVESGSNGWSHTGNTDLWHISTNRSYSASHSWYFGYDDQKTYANYIHAWLVTPPVALYTGSVLRFWHWPDMELSSGTTTWDGGLVEISTNDGLSYEQITPVGGYPYTIRGGWGQPLPGGTPVFSGAGGWTQAVFDLADYGAQNVRFRFRFGSDQQNDYVPEGWFIDDLVVEPGEITNAWLAAAPTSGVVAAGTVSNVVLSFDAAGFTNGALAATRLLVACNDPDAATSLVAVALHVAEPPVITHTPLQNTTNTVDDYVVAAGVAPETYLNTNELKLLWNTNGSTTVFTTGALARVGEEQYQGQIPAQAAETRVYYYLSAMAGMGLVSTHPSSAPATLHSFDVTVGRTLSVTGTPGMLGTVWPAYGEGSYASGAVISASALPGGASNNMRYACTGWVGTGSVPALGGTSEVTFALGEDSTIDWQWSVQFALRQSGSVAGVLGTTTWWFAGSTGTTETASDTASLGGTNYHLAQWLVDGSRWPDATNATLNPAAGIPMPTSRVAMAFYLPADRDLDGDDLDDWWEYYYFGSMSVWRDDDADGDGYSNVQEFRDRTHPKNTNSIPAPPVIVHTPLGSPQQSPAPWPVLAVATDNYLVAGVTLRWQRNGGSWNSTAMVAGVSNQYTGAIPVPGTNGDTFVYRIQAQDAAGWTTTNGPYLFSVAFAVINLSPSQMDPVFVYEGTPSNRLLQISNPGSGLLTWTVRVERAGMWDDVESGPGAWTHGGSNDLWRITTNRSFSPDHAWYAGDGSVGAYENGMNCWLASDPVVLRGRPRLTFRYYADTELKSGVYAYDGGIVELATNGGVYVQIAPEGGYPYRISGGTGSPFTNDTPCFAGTGGWQSAVFDLSAWTGRAVKIRFRFGSDSSKTEEGWFLDDLAVTPYSGTNDWLTLGATSGLVSAAGASNVLFTFDPAGMAVGDARAVTLVFVANDVQSPTSSYPVSMFVVGAGTDYDGDGIPDLWEIARGLDAANAADALQDQDLDGFLSIDEYVADTDPTSAASLFELLSIARQTNRIVVFVSSTARVYGVHYSTNLLSPDWTDLVTGLWGSAGSTAVADTNDAPSRSYRISVELP